MSRWGVPIFPFSTFPLQARASPLIFLIWTGNELLQVSEYFFFFRISVIPAYPHHNAPFLQQLITMVSSISTTFSCVQGVPKIIRERISQWWKCGLGFFLRREYWLGKNVSTSHSTWSWLAPFFTSLCICDEFIRLTF